MRRKKEGELDNLLLRSCQKLIEEQNWTRVAAILNNPRNKDFMLRALRSLKNVEAIKKALSYQGILYTLDADTLTHFALQDEMIAERVVKQSLWQRLWVTFQVVFLGQKDWQVPSDRLQGQHIRQIWQRFATMPLQRFFQKAGELFSWITGYRYLLDSLDFRADIVKLSADPNLQVRQATSRAIFADYTLAQKVMSGPLDTVEQANARVNLVSDLGLGKTYEHKNEPWLSNFFLLGFDAPPEKHKGQYCVADDKTIEEHYYKYFLRLIQNDKGGGDPNKFTILHTEIAKLWNGMMTLPKRVGIEALVKRAMTRVISDAKVPFIFDTAPVAFYQNIFANRRALKNFIEDAASIKSFMAMKDDKLRDQLRAQCRDLVHQYYWACQQQIPPLPEFNLVHVDVVNGLYQKTEAELAQHPEIYRELMNKVLHHHGELSLMTGFPLSETSESRVADFLQDALPMDLIEFLLRNSAVQAEVNDGIEKNNKEIRGLTEEIAKLNSEKNRVEKITKKGRIKRLNEKSIVLRNVAAFFFHAVAVIKANQNGLLEKIVSEDLLPVLYENKMLVKRETYENLSEKTQQGLDALVGKVPKHKNKVTWINIDNPISENLNPFLLEACTNSEVQNQIWSNPELQQLLAAEVKLPQILLFLRASKCPKDTPQNWNNAFERLLNKDNEGLLNLHWSYLLENVPGFAAWIGSQLATRDDLVLDENKMKELNHHKLYGCDFLALLEREYNNEHSIFRKSVLEDSALLSRLLKINHPKQDNRKFANRMIRIIKREIEEASKAADKNVPHFVVQLLSTTQLDFMIDHADISHLILLLELLRPIHQQELPLKPLELNITAALIKRYRASGFVREEIKKNKTLERIVLSRCSDTELLDIVRVDPSCFDCILSNEALWARYKQITEPGALEECYFYWVKKHSAVRLGGPVTLTKMVNRLRKGMPSDVLMRVLPYIIKEVRNNPDQRQHVYQYLSSPEFSLKARHADPKVLLDLFLEAKDPRAMRLVFFVHSSLRDTLMLKCWLSLRDVDLIQMISHQFEPWINLPIRYERWTVVPDWLKQKNSNLGGDILKSLIRHICLKEFCQRIIDLAQNKTFLQAILQKVTLPQLQALLAADKQLAALIMGYFAQNEHRADFIAALQRGSHARGASQLNELLMLLTKCPEVAKLFTVRVKQDCLENESTESFDRIVIDFVRTDADHESVLKILELCNRVVGGGLKQIDSVPLNNSKTRLFLQYQKSGGLAMSTLYNRHIRVLREVWRKICKERVAQSKNKTKVVDYLALLENTDAVGEFLSFDQLIKDGYRKKGSEPIVNALYELSKILKAGYKVFIRSQHSSAILVKRSIEFTRLFNAVIKAESKWLQSAPRPVPTGKLVAQHRSKIMLDRSNDGASMRFVDQNTASEGFNSRESVFTGSDLKF